MVRDPTIKPRGRDVAIQQIISMNPVFRWDHRSEITATNYAIQGFIAPEPINSSRNYVFTFELQMGCHFSPVIHSP